MLPIFLFAYYNNLYIILQAVASLCYNNLNLLWDSVSMRILGIDPGYAIIGWGVLDYKGNKFLCGGLRRHHHAGQKRRFLCGCK